MVHDIQTGKAKALHGLGARHRPTSATATSATKLTTESADIQMTTLNIQHGLVVEDLFHRIPDSLQIKRSGACRAL